MIASWMLYSALVGALLTVSAIGLERVALARRWPARLIWFCALLLSIVWPLGGAAARSIPQPAQPAHIIPFTITVSSPAIVARANVWNRDTVDRALLVAWAALTVLLLFRLTRAVLTLRRTSGAWKSADLDGTSVRLSQNVGPAVIGLRSMDVVLPEWILSLDAPLRAIVLRHEEEHRTARDPYLLFGAALAVALMPWNLALWLQARRLRLAIELDCDARVLRAHPSTERYGMLMLTIAQRRSVGPTLFSPMLTEPITLLERRILAMRPTTRLGRVTVYGGSLLAVAALAFACSLQSDTTGPKPGPIAITDNQTLRDYQVETQAQLLPGNAAPLYPQELRDSRTEGTVVTQFVVDTTGQPIAATFRVLQRTDDRFVPSVRAAVPNLHFSPALVGGKKMKQLVQMPFTFSLSNDAGGSGLVSFKTVATPNRKAAGDVRGVAATAAQNGAAKRTVPAGVYLDYQVEVPVTPRPNSAAPRYPDSLRVANVQGEVLVQFVVNENGRADMSSFYVLKSSHELFTNAVRLALPNVQFSPALVGGQPVKQLVQMPFQFNLSK